MSKVRLGATGTDPSELSWCLCAMCMEASSNGTMVHVKASQKEQEK